MIQSRILEIASNENVKFKISYVDLPEQDKNNDFYQHTHEEHEVYVNISGDVSFMVENTIYPINAGDIILTRPHEGHHCIYNSDARHRHFWILFSGLNKELCTPFYNREKGENNRLSLNTEDYKEFTECCQSLLKGDMEKVKENYFISKFLYLLSNATPKVSDNSLLSQTTTSALTYIAAHFKEAITVKQIAKECFCTVNTLERKFKKELGINPAKYLFNKRLENACKQLHEGKLVQEACEESGFPDYAHFISAFKREIGVTPLQYKKSLQKDK